MVRNNYPRIVICGLSGDSGKTVVSCGLLACMEDLGYSCTAFKKGPDYIDTAWLSFSSGKPARNLDTYLMGAEKVKYSFLKNGTVSGINIIEGNRGLFDGIDVQGTHSSAELAKILKAPVIIVLSISKVTRTAAASVLGCIKFDPDLNIAGVILNQVAGERHGSIAKDAIESITGIPVLGIIPKQSNNKILPSRHLGLITPDEFTEKTIFINDLKKLIYSSVDINRILEIAQSADLIGENDQMKNYAENYNSDRKIKIGYFKDQSFSFYYPENLEMLSEAGADLIPVSPSSDTLPEDLDLLYIGGGFPETNLTELSSNKQMFISIKEQMENGLPVYAECGGLMYLSEEVEWKNKTYPLSGILPLKIKMYDKPQGHGYTEVIVDNQNPFFKVGEKLRGHEFHYSGIVEFNPSIRTAFSVIRGSGCFNKRDGLIYKNVFASYLHLHALATPEWLKGIIKCASDYNYQKKTKELIER